LALIVVAALAGNSALDYWRDRHEALTERAVLRVSSCAGVSQSKIQAGLRIIKARLDDDGLHSYRFTVPEPCTIYLDLPNRSQLETTARELTGGGNFTVYGMGTLPVLADDGRMIAASDRMCDAPPPCILLRSQDIDRGAVSAGTDQVGDPQVSFAATYPGSARLADYTTVHQGQSMVIVLDGQVLMDATIETSITNGSGVINGIKSAVTADRIAAILKEPPVPVAFTFVSFKPIRGGE
jgi:preprotein translocase subunit SecD